MIAEHGGAMLLLCVLHRALQQPPQPGAVKDIVPQHHTAAVVANKVRTQDKGLGQPVRGGLLLVAEPQTKPGAVPQERLESGQIPGRTDNENIPHSRQHQRGQRIVDHRLIIHRQQLLGGDLGQRIQPGAAASCQNYTFHTIPLPGPRRLSILYTYYNSTIPRLKMQ